MKQFSKIIKACLFADLVVCGLSFGTSAYNLMGFYSVPEVSKLSTEDHGIIRTRNYRDRRDVLNDVKDPVQHTEAETYLNGLETSNAVIGISGLAAICAGSGLVLTSQKNRK